MLPEPESPAPRAEEIHLDAQRLAVEIITQVQRPDTAPVYQLVVHEFWRSSRPEHFVRKDAINFGACTAKSSRDITKCSTSSAITFSRHPCY